jgi:exodeoxyribonuclease III
MRIISFNVNGIRAIAKKQKNGTKDATSDNNCLKVMIEEQNPDILCLQEIKTSSPKDLDFLKTQMPFVYTNHSTVRKGYSGVALLSKIQPLKVTYNFDRIDPLTIDNLYYFDFNKEGRLITAEFEEYVVISCYTPNSKANLARIDERCEWECILRSYMSEIQDETDKPVILCGDLNVCHTELDYYGKQSPLAACQSPLEKFHFERMITYGYVDALRYKHPSERIYTHWSNFCKSRKKTNGWRLDYFMVAERIRDYIVDSQSLDEYFGSDHCPIVCDLDF